MKLNLITKLKIETKKQKAKGKRQRTKDNRMFDWLKILGLTIISPTRGLSEAHIRSPFLPAVILLFVTQSVYYLYLNWDLWQSAIGKRITVLIFGAMVTAFVMTLVVLVFIVPVLIAMSNFFDRRGNITQVVQQEFTPAASTVSYAYSAINLLSLIAIFLIKKGSLPTKFATWYLNLSDQMKRDNPEVWNAYFTEEQLANVKANPEIFGVMLFYIFIFPITLVFVFWAVRVMFRMSWLRTIITTICAVLAMPLVYVLFNSAIGFVVGSPLLLILSFFLLQGYFRDIARKRQAQVDFKRSLEISTLNPADASAHYNLGLLYHQRNNLEEARKSFEKAVEIDDDEIDAHYQLGRIARQQNRLQDAVNHFSQVVSQSQNHAQYEIWREIGTTYIAANQFSDAKDALDNFLAERPSDPEGLYLMGSAQAGLGDKRAAISFMQACIEAVKTSPNYKYRIDKRWMNEAEKFLKTNA